MSNPFQTITYSDNHELVSWNDSFSKILSEDYLEIEVLRQKYNKEIIQTAYEKAMSCNCCQRHQIRKNIYCQKTNEQERKYDTVIYEDCHCMCRQRSRKYQHCLDQLK